VTERSQPRRTCIGCRVTSAKSDLLRIVAVREQTGPACLVPDPRGRLPGRALPLQYRIDALACETVPLGFTVWAMWSLRQLFANYARGKVFSPEPLRHLNNVANALFLGVLAEFVMQAPISYLLTWYLGPHHRSISLSFGSNDAAWLFIAGTVLVIARVMAEARRVADENAAFV